MNNPQTSTLDGLPEGIPQLQRAVGLQQRAAHVGFDWQTLPPVLAKVHEELGELETEIHLAGNQERQQAELGDLLFAVANLARKLGFDPEQALAVTNGKFQRRFQAVESELAVQGKTPSEATLEEMDAIWERTKSKEP